MGKETPSIRKTLAAAEKATTLRIHFPEAAAREAGVRLSTAASKPAPTLSMSTSVSTSASPPDARYLAVSIDLDAPFPSFPFLGPILHGLHVDLVLDAAAADDDGFAPLRSAAAAATADDEEEGGREWLVPYVGPGPPRPSAAHRYLFMVFAQPPALDAAGIRALLGLGRGGADVGLMARMRWDQEAFERRLGLGEVLAGSYFLTRA